MQTRNTESRGAWLFEKMSAIYGARFLDLWRDVNPEAVHAEWSAALRGMKREDLQRGVVALYRTRYAPTLPEFIALCEPPAPVPLAQQFRLESAVDRTDSETARSKLADIADAIPMKAEPGIAWAHKVVKEAATQHVPALKLAIAREAIRQYEASHPPRERSPGDDDEPEVTQ